MREIPVVDENCRQSVRSAKMALLAINAVAVEFDLFSSRTANFACEQASTHHCLFH
jgi:hypothetical protein